MAGQAFREEGRELLDGGARLVEVLPREEYEEEHIAGAINIPLKELGGAGDGVRADHDSARHPARRHR